MLLLHPPQAKPGEPPAGLPLLAGALRGAGQPCTVCDLNIEALHFLIEQETVEHDTWSRRAAKNRHRNLAALCDPACYSKPDRYRRAVADINRLLENRGKEKGLNLSLGNYQDQRLSPQKRGDLLEAARRHSDNIYHPLFSRRIDDLISATRPASVGISLNFLSQALCAFAIAGYLRKRYPDRQIILGGGLVTTWLRNLGGRNPFTGLIDQMVAGPGEGMLCEMLGCVPPNGPVTPDYTDLATNTYLSPGFILPYATSSGCFWRKCAFCPETSEGNAYRPLPPQRVVQDLAALAQASGAGLIHLLDNAISPVMLKTLADQPPPAPWYGFVRFTSHLADEDFCHRLKASGCAMLKLGLESGNQEVLDGMCKGNDLPLVEKVLAALHRAGIATYVYLLFGTPGESLAEARDTLHFVLSHHREIGFLNLAIFNLPVGSKEARELTVSDFYEGDLSLYHDFRHPGGWDRKEIRRFLETEFKKERVIREIVQRDPPHFTSNHAPFFTGLNVIQG